MQGDLRRAWRRLAPASAAAGLILVLVGCPGGKPAVKRGKRPTKGRKAERGKGAPSAELAAFGMADAACYIRAKPAALAGTQAFKRFIEGAQKLGFAPFSVGSRGPLPETIRKETGVDIDQVTQLNAAVAGDLKRFLLAALFKSPYDAGKIMETGLRKFGSHKGVDLLRPPGAEENVALALASPTVLAQGELEAIKSSIDRMKAASSRLGAAAATPPAVRKLMESAPAEALIVVVIPSPGDLAKAQAARGVQVTADVGEFKDLVLAVTSGENFDLWLHMYAADADRANQARADAQAALDQSRTQPNPMLDTPELAPLKDLIKSVRIGGRGATIEVTATMKPEVVGAVPALMGMFFGGMMPGPGGGGGGGDFDFGADFE